MKEFFSMTIYDNGKVEMKWEKRKTDVAIPARAMGRLYQAAMSKLLQEKVITEKGKKRMQEFVLDEFYAGMMGRENQGHAKVNYFKNYAMQDEQDPPRARRRF